MSIDTHESTDNDTIVAIATAAGQGGVGVIRASGSSETIHALMQAVCQQRTLTPRHAHYGAFVDADGAPIDHGIALYFPAPHSYTGEHVLELQGHGGPVVMQLLLRRCLNAVTNIRLAQAGEFTQRAFLNDKMDLAQAEGVADLISAATESAAKSAVRSLSGVFSNKIHDLVAQVIHLRMLVEATLDFPEEEIDFLQKADAFGQLERIQNQLGAVLQSAKQGALLRNGVNIVLVGQPNVGKSSLLNALAGQDVAIVTEIAGTTRDTVQQAIQIEGVPLNIIDTAGLRETNDVVEKIGIERTWAAVANADVVLHLVDARDQLTHDDSDNPADAQLLAQLHERVARNTPFLTLFNKADTLNEPPSNPDENSLYLSAKTGAGLDALRARLLKIVGFEAMQSDTFIARERHLGALRMADEHLQAAYAHALTQDQKLDLFAEELRLAQEQLNSITGEFGADDLLGVIFSSFCIGK
ncbi:MAG: tRNA uridine-5-carboxymethylaminomethyl(34) synthesis GTPase MnmE [Burkholderiales bacterium]|nr:tRNA uridine-5-carboxymethylaminomethyl(34) synthesis GTPase MnmE [Burkholderiales bacterium]